MSEKEPVDLENEVYVIVEDVLDPKIHLFDQPPFNWARVDPSIIPDDFFTKENGWYVFCNAVLNSRVTFKRYSDSARTTLKSSLTKYNYIDEKKYDISAAIRVGEGLQSTLKQHYPYILDYVGENRPFFSSTLLPRKLFPSRVSTYAAYAARKQEWDKTEDVHQWAGLPEELPSTFSTLEDISEAMPSKSRVNRQFRLLKSIGFKK